MRRIGQTSCCAQKPSLGTLFQNPAVYAVDFDDPEIKAQLLAMPLPPGSLPGPGQFHFKLREALRQLGFRTTLVERLATHPVWGVRFAQPTDNVCRDVGRLSRLLKRALNEIGITTQPGRLTMRLTGRYVVLSFLSEQGEQGELLGGADQFIPTPLPPEVEAEPDPGPDYDPMFIAGLDAWPEPPVEA